MEYYALKSMAVARDKAESLINHLKSAHQEHLPVKRVCNFEAAMSLPNGKIVYYRKVFISEDIKKGFCLEEIDAMRSEITESSPVQEHWLVHKMQYVDTPTYSATLCRIHGDVPLFLKRLNCTFTSAVPPKPIRRGFSVLVHTENLPVTVFLHDVGDETYLLMDVICHNNGEIGPDEANMLLNKVGAMVRPWVTSAPNRTR
jgi:hypothetical protein